MIKGIVNKINNIFKKRNEFDIKIIDDSRIEFYSRDDVLDLIKHNKINSDLIKNNYHALYINITYEEIVAMKVIDIEVHSSRYSKNIHMNVSYVINGITDTCKIFGLGSDESEKSFYFVGFVKSEYLQKKNKNTLNSMHSYINKTCDLLLKKYIQP